MKTEQNKFGQFNQNRNIHNIGQRQEELNDYQNDLNEERIISSYKAKEKIFYYDNSAISMSYGQYNVEKCLIVLFLLIVYSACLVYNYYLFLDNLKLIILIICFSLDIIVSFLYIYFLIKLKSDEVFNRIPTVVVNSTDIIILINFIVKIASIILICFDYATLGILALILFAIKFLIEFYFAIISVKILMFCPCSVYIQEQTEKLWIGIKYYVFCCEADNENENAEYTRIEDGESFY